MVFTSFIQNKGVQYCCEHNIIGEINQTVMKQSFPSASYFFIVYLMKYTKYSLNEVHSYILVSMLFYITSAVKTYFSD